jgi:pilus assembly protein Flp/PilA
MLAIGGLDWDSDLLAKFRQGGDPQRKADFLVSEDGPTAVEYAVMLALIIVACVAIVQNLGTRIRGTFSSASGSLGS